MLWGSPSFLLICSAYARSFSDSIAPSCSQAPDRQPQGSWHFPSRGFYQDPYISILVPTSLAKTATTRTTTTTTTMVTCSWFTVHDTLCLLAFCFLSISLQYIIEIILVVIQEMDWLVKGQVAMVVLCRHGAEPEILGFQKVKIAVAFVLVQYDWSTVCWSPQCWHQGPIRKKT